ADRGQGRTGDRLLERGGRRALAGAEMTAAPEQAGAGGATQLPWGGGPAAGRRRAPPAVRPGPLRAAGGVTAGGGGPGDRRGGGAALRADGRLRRHRGGWAAAARGRLDRPRLPRQRPDARAPARPARLPPLLRLRTDLPPRTARRCADAPRRRDPRRVPR